MDSDVTPLLHLPLRRRSSRIAVSSKSATVVLLLNFSVLMAYNFMFNVNNLVKAFQTSSSLITVSVIMCVVSILSVLAGLLTDIKYGRYKTILYTFFILPVGFGLLPLPVAAFVCVHLYKVIYTIICVIIAALCLGIMLSTFVVFITNAVQFGMDQLHDCSTQDSILYVHWYVWINYLTAVISTLPWTLILYDPFYFYIDEMRITGTILGGLIFLCVLLLLILSLYIVRCKHSWFLIEQVRINPYKLLYRVIRFAWRHKIPVYRSAFTYCEDEIPSRLDLGKAKYGGPFTTEQVEDVKAFFGGLKVLLVVGPIFMLQLVQELTLLAFSEHGIWHFSNETGSKRLIFHEGVVQHVTLSSGLLSPLLVVVCIPLYLRFIRPRILNHIPGIMKRIGIGIFLMILSLCCAFAMDIVVHSKDQNVNCMLNAYTHSFKHKSVINGSSVTGSWIYQNIYYFIAQSILIALSNMTFDIAVLEFIASQSPYFMKGLLFGVFFAVRSLLQATALLSMIPFSHFWKNIVSLSCGSGFYLMNITVGLAVFMMYVYVAKRYKYRERDEPSHEYRYADDYYSKYHY